MVQPICMEWSSPIEEHKIEEVKGRLSQELLNELENRNCYIVDIENMEDKSSPTYDINTVHRKIIAYNKFLENSTFFAEVMNLTLTTNSFKDAVLWLNQNVTRTQNLGCIYTEEFECIPRKNIYTVMYINSYEPKLKVHFNFTSKEHQTYHYIPL